MNLSIDNFFGKRSTFRTNMTNNFLYALQVVCALIIMAREGSLKKTFSNWTVTGALTASGLPAIIYALQNSLLQIAYKNLDSLTFSMLNQTKILFTAVCTYLLLRYVPIFLLSFQNYNGTSCFSRLCYPSWKLV